MWKQSLYAILIFILPFCASAQKANFQFYTTQDGLSGSFTQQVAQGPQGLLWVLNDYKLHRFDGHKFTLFMPPSDLPGSQEGFKDFLSYRDSLLFVNTDKHVYLMHLATGQWEDVPHPFHQEGADFKISLFGTLKDESILVQSYSEKNKTHHFWRFDDGHFELVFTLDSPDQYLYSKALGPDDEIVVYAGYYNSGNTFYVYNLRTRQRTTKKLEMPDEEGSIRFSYWQNNQGYFVTGQIRSGVWEQQIYRCQGFLDEISLHPASRFIENNEVEVFSLLPDKKGNLWLCGNDRQLSYYDAQLDTLYDFTPSLRAVMPNKNRIIYLYLDQTGTAWVLTELGLLKVTLHDAAFQKFFDQPTAACAGFCSFRGITETAEGDLFASYYYGLAHFNSRQPATAKKDFSLPAAGASLPSGLIADSHGLWLNNGQLLDPQTRTLRQVPGAKEFLHEEGLFARGKDGPIWWVFMNELFSLETQKGQLQWKKELELPVEGTIVTNAIQVGRQGGKVFIGHDGKLLQYDPATQQQTWYGPLDWGLSVTRIMAIEEGADGTIWLATDIGLAGFDPTKGQTRLYTMNEGLPNNFVCGMLAEGDSCLWLSTNDGLSRFHLPSESFNNFFEEDGLTYNEFNRKSYYKAPDGRMYFGGLRGINAFYPEEVIRDQQRRNEAAMVALSAFEFVDEKRDTTIRRQNFSAESEIHLYYGQRSFTFEYALTDFRNPQQVAYSYQMEGYEDNWSIPSKFNFTRFSSLPTGQYIFRVKARDSHGHWHPNQLAIQVVVHPPWWATWWARTSYVLLFGSVLMGVFYFIQKRWQLKNELKLEQAEASRLKELDNFKSRLYTNLTHEFRTPLTVILGMTDRLLDGSWRTKVTDQEKKRVSESLGLIKNNGQNLLRLINQLLDLSRLENNTLRLRYQHGDVIPYLRYVTESFQTFANNKNLSLRFFTTLESLDMDFDPEQLKQVMTNLISNAVKFTPSGGEVKVSVGSEQLAEDSLQRAVGSMSAAKSRTRFGMAGGRCLLISVNDTGIGIPQAELPHVFDRFYQVDGSHTREGEGSGIGLAHTLELVKLMKGQIKVESELHKGTTFQVVLPITHLAKTALDSRSLNVEPVAVPGSAVALTEDAPLAPEVNSEQAIHPQSEFGAGYSPSTIHHSPLLPTLLIIEDNPDVVTYLKSCLSDRYQLDVAYNGQIGIDKALNTIPDLIVSDVMMPQKDGYQVCDTLKNDERTSHIPIILLTAKADAASRMTGLRRGADAYLAKPFDREELLIRLEKMIERQVRLAEHFSKKIKGEEAGQWQEVAVQEAIEVEDVFMQKVRQIVADNFSDEDFGLPQLCQKIGMSRSQLFRKMKALIYTSPSEFIRSYRLHEAKKLLETTDLNVSEVAWQVGYKDLTHFSKSFQEVFGVLPSNVSPNPRSGT